MNKSMIFWTIFAVVIAIITIFGVGFYLFSRDSVYEIIERRDFTCSAMAGYTFQYPVIKGLENVSQDSCELRIKETGREYTIFTVSVSVADSVFPIDQAKTNPNGILYVWRDSEKTSYTVQAGEGHDSKLVNIAIFSLPIWQTKKIAMMYGELSKTIINSFRVNNSR